MIRWAILLVLLVLVICVPFVLFERQAEKLSAHVIEAAPDAPKMAGLIGGALALDVILPGPSSLLNAVAGAVLGFAIGTLVCWVGMTLGCLFGYWIGATGGTALIRQVLGKAELKRAEVLAAHVGGPVLVVMRGFGAGGGLDNRGWRCAISCRAFHIRHQHGKFGDCRGLCRNWCLCLVSQLLSSGRRAGHRHTRFGLWRASRKQPLDRCMRPNQLWQTDFTYLKVIGWGCFYLSNNSRRLQPLHHQLEALHDDEGRGFHRHAGIGAGSVRVQQRDL